MIHDPDTSCGGGTTGCCRSNAIFFRSNAGSSHIKDYPSKKAKEDRMTKRPWNSSDPVGSWGFRGTEVFEDYRTQKSQTYRQDSTCPETVGGCEAVCVHSTCFKDQKCNCVDGVYLQKVLRHKAVFEVANAVVLASNELGSASLVLRRSAKDLFKCCGCDFNSQTRGERKACLACMCLKSQQGKVCLKKAVAKYAPYQRFSKNDKPAEWTTDMDNPAQLGESFGKMKDKVKTFKDKVKSKVTAGFTRKFKEFFLTKVLETLASFHSTKGMWEVHYVFTTVFEYFVGGAMTVSQPSALYKGILGGPAYLKAASHLFNTGVEPAGQSIASPTGLTDDQRKRALAKYKSLSSEERRPYRALFKPEQADNPSTIADFRDAVGGSKRPHDPSAMTAYSNWYTYDSWLSKYLVMEWCAVNGAMQPCSPSVREKNADNTGFFIGNETDIPYSLLVLRRYKYAPLNDRQRFSQKRLECEANFYFNILVCTTCCCSRGLLMADKTMNLVYGKTDVCGLWLGWMDTVLGIVLAYVRSTLGSTFNLKACTKWPIGQRNGTMY